MDKVCVVYLHNGIFFNHEEEQIMFFIENGWKLEVIMLNKISQTEKNKYCMLYLIYLGAESTP
jgi:hypothetical protein